MKSIFKKILVLAFITALTIAPGVLKASHFPASVDSTSLAFLQVAANLPTSSYNAESPETCGRCHKKELKSYRADWHGAANLFGRKDVATCVSCHGEHNVPDMASDEELVELRDEDKKAMEAYIEATRPESAEERALKEAQDDLEGKKEKRGGKHDDHGEDEEQDKEAASTVPDKPISKAKAAVKSNLETCGSCHPSTKVNPFFSAGKASFHFNPSIVETAKKLKNPETFLKNQNEIFVIVTELALIGLILFIIAFSLSVVIPHFFRTIIEVREERKGHHGPEPEGHIERLSFGFRVQHVILFVTIFVLFLTGIPIKFPEYAFSRPLMIMWGGASSAAIIHRLCAVILVINLVIHLVYMIGTRFGKKMLADMDPLFLTKNMPELKDFVLGDYMKYLWGFKKEKPKMPSFNFLMKSDYWFALIEVLGVFLPTGLILWGNDIVMYIMPKYGMDIVRQVHGWWALFSMSLVVIVHLYLVHLNPEVFPWSRIFIDGKMSLKELKSNHGEVYDELTGGYKSAESYLDSPRVHEVLNNKDEE